MPAVARLRRLMFVMPSQEAGHLGYAAKADDLQLKSEGLDFVYVGADDIYLPFGAR